MSASTRRSRVYVNRNMIGAVVGTQPFSRTGLSDTGPKAGGPNICGGSAEQVVTVNTAAAGGNASPWPQMNKLKALVSLRKLHLAGPFSGGTTAQILT